jgi:uncharacterized phage protein (TIGR02218 family)
VSRTLAVGIAAHLAGDAHKRCGMLRLDLADGSTFAVTDHNFDLDVDLGDGAATYLSGKGILASDLSLSVGFDADDIEIVTRTAILGGRFDDAVARFFQVNWSNPGGGAIKLLKGRVVSAEVVGDLFKLSIQSDVARFSQEIGRTITGYCDADFGDARCGYTVTPLAATVTAVTSARLFTVSFTGTYADDYFNRGTVTFTSGALAGCRPVEVFDWTGAGAVALWTDLAEAPAVGDTLELRQGCGKTLTDCLAYDNVVNFRGFPHVPGSDQVLRYPNSGA